MAPTIRADLFFGTVYGLALSALLWTLVFSPPGLDPAALMLLGLAVAAGSWEGRSRIFGRITATYPIALVALLLGLEHVLANRFYRRQA